MVKAMELSWDAYERYAWGYGKGLRAGGLAPGGWGAKRTSDGSARAYDGVKSLGCSGRMVFGPTDCYSGWALFRPSGFCSLKESEHGVFQTEMSISCTSQQVHT